MLSEKKKPFYEVTKLVTFEGLWIKDTEVRWAKTVIQVGVIKVLLLLPAV